MKLWGGRFEKATDRSVDDFHSSISFDQRLAEQDILGSIAHATMLGEQNIIPQADADTIVSALAHMLEEVRAGTLAFSVDAEDIHMNIETILTERIGEAGKRLHTGRSRNDQVALDVRMYAMAAIRTAQENLRALIRALLSIARENLYTVMPGYTHLQRAQPITLAHHMMAWVEMLLRDIERLNGAYARADSMPLGSGALAGTTYPLNRERVRELLGFSRITNNSLDGVADRDFLLEYLSSAAISMMHLSRFCEEVILWASAEFQFIELDDGFATGSSIMPQKKNPDVAELIRGKTGRVYGDLNTLLVMMKGIPLAYDKDMQEDKEAIFDAVDTLELCLRTVTPMLATMTPLPANMRRAAAQGFINATDCADYLTKKGMPFRDAYKCTGTMVAACIAAGKTLEELTLDEFKQYSDLFAEDVYAAIDLSACCEGRTSYGGPTKASVLHQIELVRDQLSKGATGAH